MKLRTLINNKGIHYLHVQDNCIFGKFIFQGFVSTATTAAQVKETYVHIPMSVLCTYVYVGTYACIYISIHDASI